MASNPEDLFLSALIQTQDPAALNKHNITAELFRTHKDAFTWVLGFYNRYNKLPSKDSFRKKFPEVTLYKTTDADYASEELRQEFARSSMTDLMDQTVETMLRGDVSKAMDNLGTSLLRIQATTMDRADDLDLASGRKTILDEVEERVMRVREFGNAGVVTGFPTLDHITGGLQPGWFGVVAARQGQGKTWTMVKMAVNAAYDGFTSLYYTLEQPETQVAMRTHSLLSKMFSNREIFNNMDLQRGTGFDLIEYKKFLTSLDSKLKGRMIINGARRERVTPMTVAAGIERNEPDVVFVDYITLMGMKGDGGWNSVASLSADLQQLAQRYNVPLIVGSQHNRAGEIARSDNIGMDADLILEQEQKSQHVIKQTVKKFRHGVGGQHWYCTFDPGRGVYDEISGEDARDLIDRDSELD